MRIQKNEAGILLPMTVTEGVTVNVLPYEQHEYLMTTKEVANGYGVSKYAIFKALQRNTSEIVEGKHFILGVDILSTPGLNGTIQHNSILLTKRGIVRLGFFIKSERARLFRDWAEELIIRVDEQRDLFGNAPQQKHLPAKRKHNRSRFSLTLNSFQILFKSTPPTNSTLLAPPAVHNYKSSILLAGDVRNFRLTKTGASLFLLPPLFNLFTQHFYHFNYIDLLIILQSASILQGKPLATTRFRL